MKKDYIEKARHYLFYCIMFFLPLSVFVDNVALITFFILSLILVGVKISLKEVLFSSLIPFFIYTIIMSVLNGNFNTDLNVYLKLLPLIIIPLGLSTLKNELKYRSLWYLAMGIFLMQLIAIYGIVDYYLFFEGKKVALRSNANINKILLFERPYLGYFSALNMILGFYIFKKTKKLFLLILIVVSISLIVIMSARMALIIIFVSGLVMFFTEVRNRKIKLLSTIFLTISALLIILFSNMPIKHRFMQIKFDSRMIIWEGGIKLFDEAPSYLFGYSSQKTIENKLLNYYKNDAQFEYEPDKIRFIKKNYNTHNQYLNEILRGGFLGLSLFLIPFINLLFLNFTKRHFLFAILIISIGLFLVVENLLMRQMGVYSLAIILAISNVFRDEENKILYFNH